MSGRLLPACRMPTTTKKSPTAERTAPRVSKGRVLSAGRGSMMRRLSTMIVATIAACRRKDARQLIAVVMSPPISGPAAAPMPAIPLMRPNARARDVMSVKNMVARM